jgi:hypothetical protein
VNLRSAAGLLALATSLLIVAPGHAAVGSVVGDDVDRTVRDPRITESSGLALSPTHPGVLWTHDDSGNPPLLFALGPSGRVSGTVRIPGVPDVDWEAMAAFRDAGGHAWLAAGDIGDNAAQRASVEVDVVPEPSRLADVVETPRLRLRLRYPDGPRDAETLVVDQVRRRMFVVSKGLFTGTVYAVPASAWNGTVPQAATTRSATLVAVGTVPLVLVTDGTGTPDGGVLLRTYGEIARFDPFPLDGGTRLLEPRATAALPSQQQGEGLALEPDGRSVLLSSEGTDQPVLRFALPADLRDAATPSPTSTGAGPARSTTGSAKLGASAPAPPSAGNGSGDAMLRTGLLVGGSIAGFAAVVALTAAVVVRRHARAGGRGNPATGPQPQRWQGCAGADRSGAVSRGARRRSRRSG